MPRILLVDDDDAFRKVMRLTLVEMGYTVVEARNGREALERFEQEPAELMLTDLIMPEKEGIEPLMELRAKHPAVKIIAFSGGGRMNASACLRMAKMMGADRTLAKPFSSAGLAAVLDELLGKISRPDPSR